MGQAGGSRTGEHCQTELEAVIADSVEGFPAILPRDSSSGKSFWHLQSKTPTANLQPLAQRREIPVGESAVYFPRPQSDSSWTTSCITTLIKGGATRSGELFLDCSPAEHPVGC